MWCMNGSISQKLRQLKMAAILTASYNCLYHHYGIHPPLYGCVDLLFECLLWPLLAQGKGLTWESLELRLQPPANAFSLGLKLVYRLPPLLLFLRHYWMCCRVIKCARAMTQTAICRKTPEGLYICVSSKQQCFSFTAQLHTSDVIQHSDSVDSVQLTTSIVCCLKQRILYATCLLTAHWGNRRGKEREINRKRRQGEGLGLVRWGKGGPRSGKSWL